MKHFLRIGVALCMVFFFWSSSEAIAFYEVNNQGGGCRLIGKWTPETLTCTLRQDVFETIRVTSPGVTIDGDGYTIDVSDYYDGVGVYISDVVAVTVQNTQIVGASVGIDFNRADGANAYGNVIEGAAIGVSFFELRNGRVSENTISNSSLAAISTQAVEGFLVQNNTIADARTAVRLDRTLEVEILQNRIKEVSEGITIRNSPTSSEISNNLIETALVAIRIDTTVMSPINARHQIHHNTITQAATGLQMVDTSGGPVRASWWQSLRARLSPVTRAYAQAEEVVVFLYQNTFAENETHVAIENWGKISLFDPESGYGNYWDTFDESSEGCVDEDGNGVCDAGYQISGLSGDSRPLTTPVAISPLPPACNDGRDNDGDGYIDFPLDPGCRTVDGESELNEPPLSLPPTCTLVATPDTVVAGQSTVLSWTSADADTVLISPEVGEVAISGSLTMSPTTTTLYRGLVSGQGGDGSCEVRVEVTPVPTAPLSLHEQAAALAKQVVSAPYLGDGNTFGGKGWDYRKGAFVSPESIFAGYTFWNNKSKEMAFGAGLDCSGLVMWAFNRANNPALSNKKNIVLNEGADGQFLYNVEEQSLDKESLRPGDLLFFAKGGKPSAFKHHVAMYVGENRVIEALNPDQGIVNSDLNLRIDSNLFINEFRRIKPANTPAMSLEAASPINLVVTDPEGYTISAETVVATDNEHLTEVSGELYYSEMVQGHDGRPADWVYSYEIKDGIYIITVETDETATADDTYSLTFRAGEHVLELAKDAPISTIPARGYAVSVSAQGKYIEAVEPATSIEELFGELEIQILTTNIHSRLIAARLYFNYVISRWHFERSHMKATIRFLNHLDKLVVQKTGKGIMKTEAEKLRATIAQLIHIIQHE